MAITILEKATVSEGIQVARRLVNDIKPVLDRLNVIYDSAGGVKETLDQAKLNEVADWSGITETQVDDAMFAITSTLRTALTNSYTQLVQLASRG